MRSRIPLLITALIIISLVLAWVSTDFQSVQGWTSFLAVVGLGTGLLLAGWWGVKLDPVLSRGHDQKHQSEGSNLHGSWRRHSQLPAWLSWLLICATMLRLGAGILWFVTLPTLGYGSEVEISGYVMADAFDRDRTAWELSQSEKPLIVAFSKYRGADQYGGYLFGSALIYRYLGGNFHKPLQIVVLSASISSLAVLFTWAFVRRIWDASVAGIAAWIVTLFPDAILLGSSQMREAIMMSLVVIAFYGVTRLWQDRSRVGGIWMVFPLLIAFPLSPLFGVMLATMLGVFALFLGKGSWLKDWRVWGIMIGLVALGLIVVAIFGEQILPGEQANPLSLLQRWFKQAGRWQAYNAERASGWMQKIFRSTPEWTHGWLLLIYGIARPFLPAALFDSAAAIWQSIAIWRSIGWVLLLPFLVAAPLVSWQRVGWRSPPLGLSLLVWLGIIISSFRGGGDHWDNPRYRVTWIGLQATLAAWVWVTQRRDRSPWLRRVLIGMGCILIWWIPWYVRRITDLDWPVQDVFLTLGLGIGCALLYLVIDVIYERIKY
jgi:hypothetical protein